MPVYDKTLHADLTTRESALRERIAAVGAQMHDLKKGGDGWTPDKDASYSRMAVERSDAFKELDRVASDLEQMNQLRPPTRREKDAPFRRFLRGGVDGLGAEDSKTFGLAPGEQRLGPSKGELFVIPQDRELRAAAFGASAPLRDGPGVPTQQMVALGSGGSNAGNIGGIMTSDEYVDNLAYIGTVMQAFRMSQRSVGGTYRTTQFDTKDDDGEFVDQPSGAPTQGDLSAPSTFELIPHTAGAKKLNIRMEALTDAVGDLEGYARRQLQRRLMRFWNRQFTKAEGNTVTDAYVKSSTQGVRIPGTGNFVATTPFGPTSETASPYDNFVDLEHSLDLAYLEASGEGVGLGMMLTGNGMIGYTVSYTALGAMRKIKDTQGRPLWLPSLIVGTPDEFLGRPLVVNGHMDAVAADAIPVTFGNMGSFETLQVGATQIYRFEDSGTVPDVQFQAYNRMDGRTRLPLEGGKNPAIAHILLGG
ncbi:MAG: phage major capsid protein [Bryobacterales bacterium]|nr:phage major capsid protein [Bryobacterales bacterium]